MEGGSERGNLGAPSETDEVERPARERQLLGTDMPTWGHLRRRPGAHAAR